MFFEKAPLAANAKLVLYKIYTAFTHEGLTTRYRKESLNKSIFKLSMSRDI